MMSFKHGVYEKTLRYTEPTLKNPKVIKLDATTKYESAVGDGDVIIVLPNTTRTADTFIWGGNNIVIKGGRIENAKLHFSGQKNSVYVEGVEIVHNKPGYHNDGIYFGGDKNLDARKGDKGPDLIVQNTRITGIDGKWDGVHGDMIQADPFSGVVGNVYIHNFYGSSSLQGITSRAQHDGSSRYNIGDLHISQTKLDHARADKPGAALYYFYSSEADKKLASQPNYEPRKVFLYDDVWLGLHPDGTVNSTTAAASPNWKSWHFPIWSKEVKYDLKNQKIDFPDRANIYGDLYFEIKGGMSPIASSVFGAGAGLNYKGGGSGSTAPSDSTQSTPASRSSPPPESSSQMSGKEIVGTSGNDRLTGTPGDDLMRGLAGHDTLFGMEGDDVFYPGQGSDFVYGGPGRDVVVIKPGEGSNKWMDFTRGQDKIKLEGGLRYSHLTFNYDSTWDYLWVRDSKTGEGLLGLKGLKVGQISADDFLIG